MYLELLLELDQENVLSILEAEKLWKRIKQYPFYHIYVATAEEKIIGTFTLIICDNFGHGGLNFAIVENMIVHPDCERMGIGKKMMDEAMRIATENGCYKLMLSSNKTRKNAHAFYDSLGFIRHGVSFMTELINND